MDLIQVLHHAGELIACAPVNPPNAELIDFYDEIIAEIDHDDVHGNIALDLVWQDITAHFENVLPNTTKRNALHAYSRMPGSARDMHGSILWLEKTVNQQRKLSRHNPEPAPWEDRYRGPMTRTNNEFNAKELVAFIGGLDRVLAILKNLNIAQPLIQESITISQLREPKEHRLHLALRGELEQLARYTILKDYPTPEAAIIEMSKAPFPHLQRQGPLQHQGPPETKEQTRALAHTGIFEGRTYITESYTAFFFSGSSGSSASEKAMLNFAQEQNHRFTQPINTSKDMSKPLTLTLNDNLDRHTASMIEDYLKKTFTF